MVNIAIKNIHAAIKCLVWNTSAHENAVVNGSLLVMMLDILRGGGIGAVATAAAYVIYIRNRCEIGEKH